MAEAKRLAKKEFLAHWSGMKRRRKLNPTPVPYKHRGSKYSEDTLRITGSREFIDAILSRLTELLQFENGDTRLQVTYQQAVDKDTRQPLDSWVCHIQVHERGDEAKIANALVSGITGKQTIISRGY